MKQLKLFYKQGEPKEIESLPDILPGFHTMGQYPGDFGKYTDDMWRKTWSGLHLSTRKLKELEVPAQWILDEQKRCNVPVHYFSHTTAALESDKLYRPPFHLQCEYSFLCRKDILESVWLLNEPTINIFGKKTRNPTRELDLSESGRSWHRRAWFADHFGKENYTDRQMSSVELFFPPRGVQKLDIFVYPDYAERYLNGYLIKRSEKDLDFEYRILATLIVNNTSSGDADWNIKKLAIKKL